MIKLTEKDLYQLIDESLVELVPKELIKKKNKRISELEKQLLELKK